MSIAIITNSDLAAGHPDQPDLDNPAVRHETHQRVVTAEESLVSFGEISGIEIVRLEAPLADWDDIELVHPRSYIESFKAACKAAEDAKDGQLQFGEEATLSSGTEKAALSAVGAGLAALKLIDSGSHKHAICVVRPAGHHAEPEQAMGFCFISNAAVIAAYAERYHGKRVTVIDFDVHQGNGTAAALCEHNNIQLVDLYLTGGNEYPYPAGLPGRDYGPNIHRFALPEGTSGEEYLAVFSEQAMPAVRKFEPDLIIFSAGFDSLSQDPLGGFSLTPKDLFKLVKETLSLGTPSIAMLEGGYELRHLELGLAAHLLALKPD